MCGRYFYDGSTEEDVKRIVGSSSFSLPSGDVCPSMDAVVISGSNDKLTVCKMAWGFDSFDKGRLL